MSIFQIIIMIVASLILVRQLARIVWMRAGFSEAILTIGLILIVVDNWNWLVG